MKTSDSIDQLAKALAAAQGDMTNPLTDKTNPHFKSKYVTLAGLIDAARQPLAKHGLALVHATRQDEKGFFLVARLIHASGQWIEGEYPLPSVADRPQAIGSAITYGRRYLDAALIGMAPDHDDDANEAQSAAKNGNGADHTAGNIPDSREQSRAPFSKLQNQVRKLTDTTEIELWWKESKVARDKLATEFKYPMIYEVMTCGLPLCQSFTEVDEFWKAHKADLNGMKGEDYNTLYELREGQIAALRKSKDNFDPLGAG